MKKKLEQRIFKGDDNLKLKNISVNIKIKNIDEFETLVQEMSTIIDKIKNFKFEIEATQCEHNQDKYH